jgi:polyisoprenoid-binding protein YceI
LQLAEEQAEFSSMGGRRLIILVWIWAWLVSSAAAETHNFKIDSARTTVQFEIKHFFGKVTGQFHDVRGTLQIDVDRPENSSVTASCPTRTVNTGNGTRDNHLRSELFEVEKFPQASFRSGRVVRTSEDRADVTGDLTLHGVTRPIVFHVTLLERKNQPGGEISRWRALSDPFSRRAFGLVWSRGVEAVSGIGDAITLKIECEARE